MGGVEVSENAKSVILCHPHVSLNGAVTSTINRTSDSEPVMLGSAAFRESLFGHINDMLLASEERKHVLGCHDAW